MLESCKDAKERWGGVSQLVDQWLTERQEMLILYCAIKGLKPYSPRETPVSIKIQAFCQVLVDYLSAGHFEVYEQLFKEAKEFSDEEALTLGRRLYPRIEELTEQAIAFNDKFDTAEHCLELMTELPRELSELGESLEERFQLEDQLIEKLHNAHAELVNA